MTHDLVLRGCTTEPLSGYLRALAVLRLVSEQADRNARGYWAGRHFRLRSELDESALCGFFLNGYKPTPIIAPWQGGSGFMEGDSRAGMDAILASGDARFAEYRDTLNEIFSWPEFSGGELRLRQMLEAVWGMPAGKPRDEALKLVAKVEEEAGKLPGTREELDGLTTDELVARGRDLGKEVKKLRTAVKKNRRSAGKEEIVRACRNRLSDHAVAWLDSAVVLRTAKDLKYPPLAGTGGGEGRLDYTCAFMDRVSGLLLGDRSNCESLLRNALFAEATDRLRPAAVGQHDPGRAGGYNQGPGIEAKDFPSNAWSYVLTMEGAVVWTGGVGRRHGTRTAGVFSSPFTVRPRAMGYLSAESKDESAARAEVWVPLWERPTGYEELRTVLREGRAEWNSRPVSDALEFAEAAASLGTDRGLSSFLRYSLLKRRGDSFVALPAGRVAVCDRKDSDLLRELDPINGAIDRFAGGFKSKTPPAEFVSARRQLDTAIYDFAARGGPGRLQQILIALGRVERYFAWRDLAADPRLQRPLTGLSPRWLMAADDDSTCYRVAVALASVSRADEVGSIRANLAPIDPVKPWMWAAGKGQMAYYGNSLCERMVSVLRRRMMDGGRLGCKSLPLWGQVAARDEAISRFLDGDGAEDQRIETLLYGLTLVEWQDPKIDAARMALWSKGRHSAAIIRRDYALLKLLFHPALDLRPEPTILSHLIAGRIGQACEIAKRRLRVSGFTPRTAVFPDRADGIRLAASLLIPTYSKESLMRLVLRESENAATSQEGG